MKKVLLGLIALLLCSNAFAECHYVYINKQPSYDDGVGQNEPYDIIDIISCNKITPPEHDYNNFYLIKVDFTEQQMSLIEEYMKPKLQGNNPEKILKSRKYKLNPTTLEHFSDGKIYTVEEIISYVTAK